jgi:hypothetical protein
MRCLAPFRCDVSQRQPDQLCGRHITGEVTPGLDDLLRCTLMLWMALAVLMIFLMAGANAKNGITLSQALCQAAVTIGNWLSHSLCVNAVNLVSAASALGAVLIGLMASASVAVQTVANQVYAQLCGVVAG